MPDLGWEQLEQTLLVTRSREEGLRDGDGRRTGSKKVALSTSIRTWGQWRVNKARTRATGMIESFEDVRQLHTKSESNSFAHI